MTTLIKSVPEANQIDRKVLARKLWGKVDSRTIDIVLIRLEQAKIISLERED